MSRHDAFTILKHLGCVETYMHTRDKLRERYGLPCSPADYLRLCHMVTEDFAWLRPMRTHGDRYRLTFTYRGVEVLLVYDLDVHLVITALTRPTLPEVWRLRNRQHCQSRQARKRYYRRRHAY